jgi:hypothetical protein
MFISYSIQSVPRGKISILGGHSIGYSKQKIVYVHMSYALYSSKIVAKKELLRTVSNTSIQVAKFV